MDSLPTELILHITCQFDLQDKFHLSLTNHQIRAIIEPVLTKYIQSLTSQIRIPEWKIPSYAGKSPLGLNISYQDTYQLLAYFVSIKLLPSPYALDRRSALQLTAPFAPRTFSRVNFHEAHQMLLDLFTPQMWAELSSRSDKDQRAAMAKYVEGLDPQELIDGSWYQQPALGICLELQEMWEGLRIVYEKEEDVIVLSRRKTSKREDAEVVMKNQGTESLSVHETEKP
ncbi:uncharacterized protein KY384_003482 [Bacidia gigantensis]|uniref:uncharacterized protein n=1 Tax=Bacidia gigantensis TaxID=2732470 RepID=UPI001D03BFD4|nr:uncharacterized protein KY384_003482 [Bacidia gigantensis]KAG8531846.1 hypothetical protein KY384_003482 [Bacidia gigantensis]